MPLLALILACIVPGAGHAYIGRVWRGVIIFAVIGATFWTGVAIGGVMTVDYYGERWWFAAQMCAGMHGLVGWRLQQRVYDRLSHDPKIGELDPPRGAEVTYQQMLVDQKLAEEGLALVPPADTLARAYAGVAGLLNLMCIFDAVLLAIMGVTGEPARPARDEPTPPKGGSS